jgi:hypothetical protein
VASIDALYWSAAINIIIVVPPMVAMMSMSTNVKVMGTTP